MSANQPQKLFNALQEKVERLFQGRIDFMGSKRVHFYKESLPWVRMLERDVLEKMREIQRLTQADLRSMNVVVEDDQLEKVRYEIACRMLFNWQAQSETSVRIKEKLKSFLPENFVSPTYDNEGPDLQAKFKIIEETQLSIERQKYNDVKYAIQRNYVGNEQLSKDVRDSMGILIEKLDTAIHTTYYSLSIDYWTAIDALQRAQEGADCILRGDAQGAQEKACALSAIDLKGKAKPVLAAALLFCAALLLTAGIMAMCVASYGVIPGIIAIAVTTMVVARNGGVESEMSGAAAGGWIVGGLAILGSLCAAAEGIYYAMNKGAASGAIQCSDALSRASQTLFAPKQPQSLTGTVTDVLDPLLSPGPYC